MHKYLLAFISIFLGAVGQIFFKKGSGTLANINIQSIFAILTNKFLMSGILCYGVSTILWINVLSKMKLSVAYPLISFGYIITFVFAVVFLKEEVHLPQVLGLGLIMSGIILITR